jgi:hypothetical protein
MRTLTKCSYRMASQAQLSGEDCYRIQCNALCVSRSTSIRSMGMLTCMLSRILSCMLTRILTHILTHLPRRVIPSNTHLTRDCAEEHAIWRAADAEESSSKITLSGLSKACASRPSASLELPNPKTSYERRQV